MHKSVLLQETIEGLRLTKGDVVIDATTGAGGHTKAILEVVGSSGKVLAIDRDVEALSIASNVTRGENVTFAHANFTQIEKVAKEKGFTCVSATLADLGVSSMQLTRPHRGFSLKSRGVLDMRMDKSQELSALTVVNEYSEDELARIFRNYGEEKRARACAKAIALFRKHESFKTTDQLAEVVRGVIPASYRGGKKIDPATKVFQAIRIEVNDELTSLESTLPQMVRLLAPGGRMAIISFHSLEDRIVKQFFSRAARDCLCPPEFPKCQCNHKKSLKIITRKPIRPTEDEIAKNPRARSAKLRIAEKIN
ncbi:MAG: 16S rRNA (cytosine(1402)-N(4))-methyltransferase RsmH [Patescibacteria group bacterium]|nr:16S rRNA (cytosine(1402)-N(4))-methyltransferase RsmH [Patescibacteria group bacterium]